MGVVRKIGLGVVLALAACGAPATQIRSRAPAPPPVVTVAAPVESAVPSPVISDAMRDHATERARDRLARAGTVAYMLTPTITRLDARVAASTMVTCAIEVHVSPTTTRGQDRWATAVGRAIVTSSASPGEVDRSIDACIDSAADEVVAHRVVPFLARSIAVR